MGVSWHRTIIQKFKEKIRIGKTIFSKTGDFPKTWWMIESGMVSSDISQSWGKLKAWDFASCYTINLGWFHLTLVKHDMNKMPGIQPSDT